jgi:hypothetical protein
VSYDPVRGARGQISLVPPLPAVMMELAPSIAHVRHSTQNGAFKRRL